MFSVRYKAITGLVVLTAFATLVAAPLASLASVSGRRNTAIGLSAGALYSAVRGKTGAAVVLGGGAAYAWKRAHDARRNSYYGYYRPYGYYGGYRPYGYYNGYRYGHYNGYRRYGYYRYHHHHRNYGAAHRYARHY